MKTWILFETTLQTKEKNNDIYNIVSKDLETIKDILNSGIGKVEDSKMELKENGETYRVEIENVIISINLDFIDSLKNILEKDVYMNGQTYFTFYELEEPDYKWLKGEE